MSHLSPAQNARLRKAMRDFCNKHHDGKITRFAKAIDVPQPGLSKILNQGGGASYITAEKFAEKIGIPVRELLGPYDAEPMEDIAEPSNGRPAVQRRLDPSASQFLSKFLKHRGLEDLIVEHEGRWKLQTVVRALFENYERDAAGEPACGWITLLDRIESGDFDARHSGDVRAATIVAKPRRLRV